MSHAVSPQNAPYAVECEAKTYFWCACGKSTNQPFCDGSHKGTEFTPVAFKAEDSKKMYFAAAKKQRTCHSVMVLTTDSTVRDWRPYPSPFSHRLFGINLAGVETESMTTGKTYASSSVSSIRFGHTVLIL